MTSKRPNFVAGRQSIERRLFQQWMLDRSTGLVIPRRGRLVRVASLSERQIAELARNAASEIAREGVRRREMGE